VQFLFVIDFFALSILRYPCLELVKVFEIILLRILRCQPRGLSVCLELFRPVPVPMHNMTVSEGNAAPLTMAVRGKVDPVVHPLMGCVAQGTVNYDGRIVDALFMFIEERKDVARAG